MSLDSQLIHTCLITRPRTQGEDLHGNAPSGQDDLLAYSGQCRLVEKTERVLRDTGDRTAVTIYKLILPPEADVREKDDVKSITLEDGSVLENAFVVNAVMARRSTQTALQSIDLVRVS